MTLILVLSVAPAARAQLTPQQEAAIANRSVVSVVVRDGTWTGRLTELTADSVTIQPDGWPARTLPLATVLKIDTKKPDPLTDGALAGAVVMGVWCLLACGQGLDHAGDLPFVAIMNGLVGAGIGAAIDASQTSRTTLYKRPGAQAARKPGLFFTVRF